MPAYHYKALNSRGKNVKGVLEADSERQLRQKLREQDLLPVEVTAVSSKGLTKSFGQQWFQPRLRLQDIALFTRQFATLLLAGIPLEEALLGVAEQTEKKNIKGIIMAVRSTVLEGRPLADAMAQFPRAFSDLYRETIHAGEQTGRLEQILNRLADYVERQQEIKQKVQQALVYPTLMIIVSFTIVTFLLIYVVPKIISVFQDSKQALPEATQLLLGISHFLGKYGIFIVIIAAIAMVAFRYFLRKPNFRRRWDLFLLKIPLIGFLIRTVNTARFARTLGMLSNSGVPIVEAMKVATRLVSSLPIRERIQYSSEQITQGRGIARALKETGHFSPMTIHLIANGEMSGKLDTMLERASQVQENELSRLIETGLTLFEPLIILIMGGVVLFIVLAVLLPIFQLDQMTG